MLVRTFNCASAALELIHCRITSGGCDSQMRSSRRRAPSEPAAAGTGYAAFSTRAHLFR